MAGKEQVKPLAPASLRFEIDEGDAISAEFKQHHHRRYIKCCGCITALVLIQAVVLLILVFTIFHVKDPKMKLNSLQIEGLDRVSEATLPNNVNNVSVIADVSIKNPNVASFKFENATTVLYYAGVVVGEALTPPGHVLARRTLRINITVDINIAKMLETPSIKRDLISRALTMSSYTNIRGRVKILNVYKKQVVAKMNCTVTVDIKSQEIREQNCKGKVSI